MNRLNLLEALSDNIRIDKQKCTFCGECVERCILDNLRMRVAPCRQACPLGLNVQAYVQLIARGLEDKAREVVSRDLPFPEIIGRICDHPCEGAMPPPQDHRPARFHPGTQAVPFRGQALCAAPTCSAFGQTGGCGGGRDLLGSWPPLIWLSGGTG